MSALSDALLAAKDNKQRASLKAQAHLARLTGPLALHRGSLTVLVDWYGALTNAAGEVIGIQVMARAFRIGNKLAIDGHFTLINPPTQVANGTVSTMLDPITGGTVERNNFKEDLAAVFEEWIFDSLAYQGRKP